VYKIQKTARTRFARRTRQLRPGTVTLARQPHSSGCPSRLLVLALAPAFRPDTSPRFGPPFGLPTGFPVFGLYRGWSPFGGARGARLGAKLAKPRSECELSLHYVYASASKIKPLFI
jgi:hypothetical protein